MKCIIPIALWLCFVHKSLSESSEPAYQPLLIIDFDFYHEYPEEWKNIEDCILRNGECDEVGEWIKARIIHRVKSGQCRRCTRRQAAELTKMVNYIKEERPDLQQEAVKKYLLHETEQFTKLLGPPAGSLDPMDTPETEESEDEGSNAEFLAQLPDKAIQSIGSIFKDVKTGGEQIGNMFSSLFSGRRR